MLTMIAIAWDRRRVRIGEGYDLREMISLPIRLPDGEWCRIEIVEAKNGQTLWVYYI